MKLLVTHTQHGKCMSVCGVNSECGTHKEIILLILYKAQHFFLHFFTKFKFMFVCLEYFRNFVVFSNIFSYFF